MLDKYQQMFNSFFNDNLYEGSKVEPKINYYKRQYKNVTAEDIDLIATTAFFKLIETGKEFNEAYLQMTINSRILDHVRKVAVEEKRTAKQISHYEINNREENTVTIKWKKDLTEDEKKMVHFLKEGLSQRQISRLGFNSNKQTALRATIKQKIVVL